MSKYKSNQIIPNTEAEIPLTWAHSFNLYFNGQQVLQACVLKAGRVIFWEAILCHQPGKVPGRLLGGPEGEAGGGGNKKPVLYEDFHIYLISVQLKTK